MVMPSALAIHSHSSCRDFGPNTGCAIAFDSERPSISNRSLTAGGVANAINSCSLLIQIPILRPMSGIGETLGN